MKDKADHEAAAQEALEEAGVIGRVHKHPMGSYVYDKRSEAKTESVQVMVYLLEVREETKDWRERSERIRKWMSATKAAKLVEEPDLSAIILRLNAMPDARLSSGKPDQPTIR